MNDIGPGDLVECLPVEWKHTLLSFVTYPVPGTIYTVRTIDPGTYQPGHFIRLEEIINSKRESIMGLMEVNFSLTHFRPVRTTDISIFTEIAQDVKDGIHRKILEDA